MSARVPAGEFVELDFRGPAEPILADRTPLVVRFAREAASVLVPGFWDGEDRYLVRFAPEAPGEWTWTTESDAAELDGLSGAIVVGPRTSPGVVRVSGAFHFAHPDGTPFRPVGTTVYNWLHQDDALIAETLTAVAEAGFNKLRFMVFPQAGDHVGGEPALLPFERTADGEWNVARPVVAFFRRLDAAVQSLADAGVQADVLIFNAYDGGRFGLDGLTEEQDSAYLRYLVARLSAYPNVWWSLCNEFDILTDRSPARWDRMGSLLAQVDPHGHLRSIHNWMDIHDHNQPWVTHASIQNGSAVTTFGRASLYRDVYRKPIVLDEIKYEGDISERWGDLSGPELVHRFWIATVAGCYASHGESFLLEDGGLHMVQGGRLRGESPPRLKFLRAILEEAAVVGLDPIDKWDDEAYQAGEPRELYLQYFGRSAPASWTFRLAQGNTGTRLELGDRFSVEVIDVWNMTVTGVPGTFVLDDVRRNDAFAHAAPPVALAEGGMLALRITRVGNPA